MCTRDSLNILTCFNFREHALHVGHSVDIIEAVSVTYKKQFFFDRSIEHIRAKKSPQVLKISHDRSDEDDDDAICLSDDGDDEDVEDEVTSLRKNKQPADDMTEKDKKRESLEQFADYFIGMFTS